MIFFPLPFFTQTPFYFIFSLHDCLPPVLHFVVLSSCEVPLDMSATELCNFAHQERISSQAEELVQTPFLLIYYLSSQVLPQTFIMMARLGFDTDNRNILEAKVFARIITLGSHPLENTIQGKLLTEWGQRDNNAVNVPLMYLSWHAYCHFVHFIYKVDFSDCASCWQGNLCFFTLSFCTFPFSVLPLQPGKICVLS